MIILRVFKNLISFLTAIPVARLGKMDVNHYSRDPANFMFLFPLIGGLIGLMAGLYSLGLYLILPKLFLGLDTLFPTKVLHDVLSSHLLTKALVGLMTLSFILVLTGLQHTDGLIDVGNALGMRGSTEDRRKIAHAWIVSPWGALSFFLVMVPTFLGIYLLNPLVLLNCLITSEVSAKLAMVTCAWLGKPAREGLGAIFVRAMEKKHSLYMVSLILALAPCYLLSGFSGLIVASLGIGVGLLMVVFSNWLFGWMTGDVFGTANEIARAASLISLVVLNG
jgi:adenosylcobinamide-GDP ribazoletransferase